MDSFLGEGTAGMLFSVGDVPAMVEGCLRILENSDLLEEMGRRGRERVIGQYHEDIVVPQYEKLYGDVIDGL